MASPAVSRIKIMSVSTKTSLDLLVNAVEEDAYYSQEQVKMRG